MSDVDKGTLDNWSVIQVPFHNENADGFTAPELISGTRPAIQGQIRGDHYMIKKGLYVITSQPVKVERLNGSTRVYTYSGSVYVLGTPHPEYDQLFPDALERLVATFK